MEPTAATEYVIDCPAPENMNTSEVCQRGKQYASGPGLRSDAHNDQLTTHITI